MRQSVTLALALLVTPAIGAQVQILESGEPKQRVTSPGRMRVDLGAPRVQSRVGDPDMVGWSTREFRNVIVDTVSLTSAVVELRLGRRGGTFSVTITTAMEPGHDQDVRVNVALFDGEEKIAAASSQWWNHDEGKTESRIVKGRHERPRADWGDLDDLALQVDIEVRAQH